MNKLNKVVVACKIILFLCFLAFVGKCLTTTIILHRLVPYDFLFFLFDVSIVTLCIILPLGEKKYKWIKRSKIPGKDTISEKVWNIMILLTIIINWKHWDWVVKIMKGRWGIQ